MPAASSWLWMLFIKINHLSKNRAEKLFARELPYWVWVNLSRSLTQGILALASRRAEQKESTRKGGKIQRLGA
jgi:hypothetical protein